MAMCLAEGTSGVAMVGMETRTGMTNPVREVGVLLRQQSARPVAFFVDAVSAFGLETIDVADWAISYCTGVPNKALEAPPGISFACVNTTQYSSRNRLAKSLYLDLSRYLEFGSRSQTPTTPAIPQLRALLKALEILEDETIGRRRERYSVLSRKLTAGLARLGFAPIIRNDNDRSPAVTVFRIPANIDSIQLNHHLREQGFMLWFPHNSALTPTMVASVMGCVRPEDVDAVVNAVAGFLAHHG